MTNSIISGIPKIICSQNCYRMYVGCEGCMMDAWKIKYITPKIQICAFNHVKAKKDK